MFYLCTVQYRKLTVPPARLLTQIHVNIAYKKLRIQTVFHIMNPRRSKHVEDLKN